VRLAAKIFAAPLVFLGAMLLIAFYGDEAADELVDFWRQL
jgi:hypothetical protein